MSAGFSSPGPPPERRSEQLRRLTELSRALTDTHSVDDLLRLGVSRAADMLGAETALLMLADGEGLLRVRAAFGVEEGLLERFQEPLDETLIHRLQGLLGRPLQESFLGVPLVVHGGVTGLLALVRPSGEPCSEEEEWLLSAVADQLAVAMENSRLEEEVKSERERRIQAVEGAGEADEAKDRALATLSHDLRSPLNAIDSFAELMEMEILGPVSERQREALARIRMSGRHLLAVLENVLEMARLNAGVSRVEVGTVGAGEVTEEAVLIVRHVAESRGQSLLVESADPVLVEADPNRLRQVLVNLVGNAIKYTQAGGTIRLRVSQREDAGERWAFISVSDTGPGIPPEKLQAIFEPYYRIHEPGSEEADGAGLGLAISRELVRQMNGDIAVESEVGKGSTFSVRLRVREQEARNRRETDGYNPA